MLRMPSLLLPLLLLALLVPSGAAAQEPPAPETFYESIDVEVVNLEVFVTDRQGNRVVGLTRDDFELLEGGKPVEITNFFAVGGEAAPPVTDPIGPIGQISPIGQTQQPTAPPVDDEQRLHLAIIIDNLSLTGPTRNRLLKSLREEVIPRLQPGDLALVGTYDGSNVELAQGLTDDRTALLAALGEVAKGAPRGVERAMEKRRILRDIETSTSPSGDGNGADAAVMVTESVYAGIRLYAQQLYNETRGTLEALTRFTDALAGLPGRKALLYVGGGLSVRPGEALFQAYQNRFPDIAREAGASPLDSFQHDLTQFFDQASDHANGNRVTFYTLGATEELAGLSAESGGFASWGSDLERMETFNMTESLQRLADATGGLSSVNGINPGPILARMRNDFDSYYSLGYVPQARKDGKHRRIEVRLRNRRDLVVRHRDGRRERTNRDRMTDRTLAALLLDPGRNPLEVEIEMGKETKNDKGQMQVEVLVKFPLAKLVLLPQGTFHEGRVSVFVSARDTKGRSSPVQEIAIPIRVPNDQLLTALGQTAAYKMPLLLRPEEHRIAVAVRDELGNVDAAVITSYTPGKG